MYNRSLCKIGIGTHQTEPRDAQTAPILYTLPVTPFFHNYGRIHTYKLRKMTNITDYQPTKVKIIMMLSKRDMKP